MYQRILIAAALTSALVTGSAAACSCGGTMQQQPGMQRSGMSCGSMQGQGMSQRGAMQKQQKMQQHFVQKVVAGVSKCGLDSAQVKKVTDAVKSFKMAKMQMKRSKMMPLDAFGKESFDKARFVEMTLTKPTASATAKGDLLEAVYAILDKEQRVIFTREFTAPMVKQAIRQGMARGGAMAGRGGKAGRGGGCAGSGCGAKGRR